MEHQLTGKAEVSVSVVPYSCYFKHIYGRAAINNVITRLRKDAKRNDLVIKTIHGLVVDGRKVVVLSNRRALCIKLKSCLKDAWCMLYLGGTRAEKVRNYRYFSGYFCNN